MRLTPRATFNLHHPTALLHPLTSPMHRGHCHGPSALSRSVHLEQVVQCPQGTKILMSARANSSPHSRHSSCSLRLPLASLLARCSGWAAEIRDLRNTSTGHSRVGLAGTIERGRGALTSCVQLQHASQRRNSDRAASCTTGRRCCLLNLPPAHRSCGMMSANEGRSSGLCAQQRCISAM